MKVTKLVVGIAQICIAAFIVFQSFAVGMANAFGNSHDSGGTAGVVVAILFIVSGIVYICTRKQEKLGGDIACLVLNLIAWLFGITNAAVYSDLQIWGWLAFIIGVVFFVWHLIVNHKAKTAN